jgi:hypothetical protein
MGLSGWLALHTTWPCWSIIETLVLWDPLSIPMKYMGRISAGVIVFPY